MRVWGLLIAIVTALASTTAVPDPPGTAWAPCFGSSAECTTVSVPVDHDAPDGPRIDIAVARLAAKDPATRRGTVIMHPGGPAPALTDGFFGTQNLRAFDELRQWYDLVLFDSRGYGKSGRLCDPAAAPNFDLSLTEAAYTKNRQATAAYAETCRAGGPALAAHASSRDVANDIDAIRVALGEDEILFYGNSYGTVFGQEYARLHGQHLSRLFLDSVLDHSAPFLQRAENAARIMERWVPDFARWCASDPGCALHGTDPAAVFDQVVAAADRAPLPTKDGGVVTGTTVRLLARYLAFPTIRATAAAALQQAHGGDGTAIAALAGAAPGNGLDAGQLTECADFPVDPADYAGLVQAGEELRATAPRIGWQAPLLSAWKCTGWSIPAANPPTPLHAPDAPPALLVNSTLDQGTSILDAQHVAAQITGSAVLPVDGMSHASYWFGSDNRCLRDAVHRYLLDNVMPPAGLSCPASVPPAR